MKAFPPTKSSQELAAKTKSFNYIYCTLMLHLITVTSVNYLKKLNG